MGRSRARGYPAPMTPTDKDLGMGARITRRDFLDGVLISAAAAALPAAGPLGAPQDAPGYYPPALSGMRGSHPGSFEAAHALRDGSFWDSVGPPTGAEETYDLVIVGAGMSGLAAAYFYRAQLPAARILILDNHDDFGGHAKRNEFTLADGRMGLINGGTLEIDSPRPYSAVADGLLRTLGIFPEALEKASAEAAFSDRFGTQRAAAQDFYEQHGMQRVGRGDVLACFRVRNNGEVGETRLLRHEVLLATGHGGEARGRGVRLEPLLLLPGGAWGGGAGAFGRRGTGRDDGAELPGGEAGRPSAGDAGLRVEADHDAAPGGRRGPGGAVGGGPVGGGCV